MKAVDVSKCENHVIKFAVLTDLHTDIIHDPEVRIEAFLNACEEQQVDFAIQLGDFIAPPLPGSYICAEEDVTDTMRNNLNGRGISDSRKKALLAMFDRLEMPFYHVLGNHDLDLYNKEEICNFWGMTAPYYSFDIKDTHFVVLDMNYGWEGEEELSFRNGNYQKWMFKEVMPFPIMPKAELQWLKEDLSKTDKKSIIFSHEGLNEGFLNAVNHEEIFSILNSAPNEVRLCINGHKHQDLFGEELGIPVYSLNSMSGYSVPSCFGATRFSPEIEAEYPNVRNMCVYEDPLFIIVEVREDGILIKGRNSRFIPPEPEDIPVVFDDPSIILSPNANSVYIKNNQVKSDFNRLTSYTLDHMKELTFIMDMDGRLIQYNQAFKKHFENLGLVFAKGEPLSNMQDTGSRFYQILEEGIACSGSYYIEETVTLEGRNGEPFLFHVCVTKSKIGRKEFLVVMMTNLTLLQNSTTALVRYTSKNIAEYILTGEDGKVLGGAEKDMTILMSDLRGFTAISKDMPAAELVTMTNHYFEAMVEPVNRYGGNILEFLGDGIFIVFGAPNDDPEHAAHAVACAIEMQQAMDAVNQWNAENGFPKLEMGIGINSGVAVAGNIGSAAQMRYGCLGENVNLAGRIEGYSVGYQILISEATKNKISVPLVIKDTQEIMPKGAKVPMTIYDITGIEGEYQISCAQQSETMTALTGPLDFEFSLIKDKVVEKNVYTASLVASSEHFGLMITDAPVQKGDNMMIEMCGGVYAKVTQPAEQGITICFTSVPDEFKEILIQAH